MDRYEESLLKLESYIWIWKVLVVLDGYRWIWKGLLCGSVIVVYG
jgi:hypothetical protein